MKKIIVCLLIIIIVCGTCMYFIFNKKRHDLLETKDVYVVPTMINNLANDSSYCPTFELIWNDLKNEVVKEDIVFEKANEFADALNKGLFTTKDISDSLYYKVYGPKTLKLKKQIEKAIKDKFNQTSDILDKFDWSEEELDSDDVRRFFFYTMLYKEFSYKYAFDKLDNDMFNNKYENIEYFGIKEDSDNKLNNQVEVLYYNSENDFAIKVLTEEDDELIFNVNPEGNTFKEIYDNILEKSSKYSGSSKFQNIDLLKIPYLDFKLLKEYTELENKPFYDKEGTRYEIMKALQTIQFEINEKGGKIKSEAGMDVKAYSTAFDPDIPKPRYFYVDETFALFLKETNHDKPYFASRIDDITKFQQ